MMHVINMKISNNIGGRDAYNVIIVFTAVSIVFTKLDQLIANLLSRRSRTANQRSALSCRAKPVISKCDVK